MRPLFLSAVQFRHAGTSTTRRRRGFAASASQDDVTRARDGGFIGLAQGFLARQAVDRRRQGPPRVMLPVAARGIGSTEQSKG